MKRRHAKPRRLNRKKAQILEQAIREAQRDASTAYNFKLQAMGVSRVHEAQRQAERLTLAFAATLQCVRECSPMGGKVLTPVPEAPTSGCRPWDATVRKVEFDAEAVIAVWSQVASRMGTLRPLVVPLYASEGPFVDFYGVHL